MPWVAALLRGQKVWAKAKADGALSIEGGRVEIRYRIGDTRAYRAGAGNLSMLDEPPLADDAFAPGEAVVSGSKSASKASPAPPAAIPDGAWIAYTDGACSGNPGPAGLGFVLIIPSGPKQEGYEFLGQATNNIAELTAVLRALEAAPDDVVLVVHTDSQYAIGVLTKGWKAKANQELIASIKSRLGRRKAATRFVYVPGHAGVALNERADELARTAIQTRASQGLFR